MNRHRAYWPLDDAPSPNGDAAWLGVNMRLAPHQLAPGEASYGRNIRIDDGSPATRPGIRVMRWGARGQQYQDPATVAKYGAVRVAEAYSDPLSGVEWIVIVTGANAFKARPGTVGSPLTIVPNQSPATASDLIQTYQGMVMLRGAGLDPLYMPSVDEGFLIPPAADPGKERIPPATTGIYFQNRLFLVDARTDAAHVDTVWVSDIGGVSDVLQGSAVYQAFKINQGSADRLVGVVKYNETTLIALKQQSVYVISNIWGDNAAITANAELDRITNQYGCASPRSAVQVGKDLWFLGFRRGICSIRQTETNALQGVDVPVSEAIQPLIDRIHWDYAHKAVAIAGDNRVYFAVPLDGATDNNAVLVYSTLTQRWVGYDFSPATKVRDFLMFTYAGAPRMGFLSQDGVICLYEEGWYDETVNDSGQVVQADIPIRFVSRGYGGSEPGQKVLGWPQLRMATWNPAYTVSLVPDGVEETVPVATVTKDRTRYLRPHGKAPWNPTNANDDHLSPHREDYSVPLPTTVFPTSGPAFDVLQQTEETFTARVEGQHVQLAIESTQGRVQIHGVSVELRRGSKRAGTRS